MFKYKRIWSNLMQLMASALMLPKMIIFITCPTLYKRLVYKLMLTWQQGGINLSNNVNVKRKLWG